MNPQNDFVATTNTTLHMIKGLQKANMMETKSRKLRRMKKEHEKHFKAVLYRLSTG